MKPNCLGPALKLLVATVVLMTLVGCSSLPPQPAMNLSEPGWVVREGQATWRAEPGAATVQGSLLVAMHWSGRNVVQFTTTNGLLVSAQSTTNTWQAQFAGRDTISTGRGKVPERKRLAGGNQWHTCADSAEFAPWRLPPHSGGPGADADALSTGAA